MEYLVNVKDSTDVQIKEHVTFYHVEDTNSTQMTSLPFLKISANGDGELIINKGYTPKVMALTLGEEEIEAIRNENEDIVDGEDIYYAYEYTYDTMLYTTMDDEGVYENEEVYMLGEDDGFYETNGNLRIMATSIETAPKQETISYSECNLKRFYVNNVIANIYANGNETLTTLVMPDSIGYITSQYFSGAKNLTTIKLPSNITKIESKAFQSCTSLTSIEIPSTVTEIGDWTFNGCTNLENVKLNEGLTRLRYECFSGCSKLKKIIIPNSVTLLGAGNFMNCTSLEYAVLSNNIKSIETNLFRYCSNLKEIIIPSGVTKIGGLCFPTL